MRVVLDVLVEVEKFFPRFVSTPLWAFDDYLVCSLVDVSPPRRTSSITGIVRDGVIVVGASRSAGEIDVYAVPILQT